MKKNHKSKSNSVSTTKDLAKCADLKSFIWSFPQPTEAQIQAEKRKKEKANSESVFAIS